MKILITLISAVNSHSNLNTLSVKIFFASTLFSNPLNRSVPPRNLYVRKQRQQIFFFFTCILIQEKRTGVWKTPLDPLFFLSLRSENLIYQCQSELATDVSPDWSLLKRRHPLRWKALLACNQSPWTHPSGKDWISYVVLFASFFIAWLWSNVLILKTVWMDGYIDNFYTRPKSFCSRKQKKV